MKLKKIALACSVALLGMSAQTFAEVSMNVGVTSNYIWRGVTQTNDAAAVSGGVDWSGESGLYAGAWASNVDFGPGTSPYELDLYGGYAGEISDFGYDVGLIYYTYDGDDDANFLEAALSGSWKFLSAGVNYTVSADTDSHEGDLYYYGGVSFDLPENFSIGATVGKYDFDDPAADDYAHYSLDLTKSAGDFGDVTLTLTDTDIDIDQDDMKAVVSWSKTF